jgi:hypothetical protein
VSPLGAFSLIVHHGTPAQNQVQGPAARKVAKVAKVMREFAHHTLHSGSKHGPTVRSRKQALAIGYAEARRGRK